MSADVVSSSKGKGTANSVSIATPVVPAKHSLRLAITMYSSSITVTGGLGSYTLIGDVQNGAEPGHTRVYNLYSEAGQGSGTLNVTFSGSVVFLWDLALVNGKLQESGGVTTTNGTSHEYTHVVPTATVAQDGSVSVQTIGTASWPRTWTTTADGVTILQQDYHSTNCAQLLAKKAVNAGNMGTTSYTPDDPANVDDGEQYQAINTIYYEVNTGVINVTASIALPVGGVPADITTTTLPDATVGSAYNQTLSTTGDNPKTFALTAGHSLPAGLSLNTSTGAITGTPTGNGGVHNFTVVVSNVAGSDQQPLSITVNRAPSWITTQVPAAVKDTVYIFPFQFAAFPLPTFSVLSGTLPTGLSLGANGVLSGTATVAGGAAFTLRMTNGIGSPADRLFNMSVVVGAPSITTTALTSAVKDAPYAFSLVGTGTAPLTWTVTGTLPTGITVNNGVFAGTPTQTGSFPLTVQLDNAHGVDSRVMTLTVTETAHPTLKVTIEVQASARGATASHVLVWYYSEDSFVGNLIAHYDNLTFSQTLSATGRATMEIPLPVDTPLASGATVVVYVQGTERFTRLITNGTVSEV